MSQRRWRAALSSWQPGGRGRWHASARLVPGLPSPPPPATPHPAPFLHRPAQGRAGVHGLRSEHRPGLCLLPGGRQEGTESALAAASTATRRRASSDRRPLQEVIYSGGRRQSGSVALNKELLSRAGGSVVIWANKRRHRADDAGDLLDLSVSSGAMERRVWSARRRTGSRRRRPRNANGPQPPRNGRRRRQTSQTPRRNGTHTATSQSFPIQPTPEPAPTTADVTRSAAKSSPQLLGRYRRRTPLLGLVPWLHTLRWMTALDNTGHWLRLGQRSDCD